MRTFPIFVSVDRKPPLVTGGGELAAIKARLLLKRAETVDIGADRLGPELAELERAGRVALIAVQPGVDQVRGRPLVIAATGDDEEDARVAAIARALGVPVNVPDKPALCSFVMPAIVDRGEVTVAIGTEGTSCIRVSMLWPALPETSATPSPRSSRRGLRGANFGKACSMAPRARQRSPAKRAKHAAWLAKRSKPR
jgi:uroporphyrin-III C-methyltransferase/precorrin-2 dehydrogenase/sirohydrochlorin ferrochelatase